MGEESKEVGGEDIVTVGAGADESTKNVITIGGKKEEIGKEVEWVVEVLLKHEEQASARLIVIFWKRNITIGANEGMQNVS